MIEQQTIFRHLVKTLVFFLLLITFQAQAQNSFLGLDGGFEGTATIVNGSTVSVPTGTNWRKSTTSATISTETSIVRSGERAMQATTTSETPCKIFSPSKTIAASTTRWQVQYYRRVTNFASSINNQTGNYRNGTEALNGTYTFASAANVWEKVTYSPTSTTSATSAAAHVLVVRKGSGGDMYFDDFVLYESATVDNTAPTSASDVMVSGATVSSLDVSWTGASGGVDGGGYMVVRYSTSPNANNDPNVNGIYAEGNTITNGTGSLTGTVAYIGTGTSFTDSGLESGVVYYYKVYTFDKAYNYALEAQQSGTTLLPTITSFSPISAKPGDVVTIIGNFDTTLTNNDVFFGATKGTVTAGTNSSLTVVVPVSATYGPITVLNNQTSLIADSMLNFIPTFSPAKTGITSADFLPKQDFVTGDIPKSVAVADLNSDGKLDLVVANSNSSSISIYRNTSTVGSITASSFASKVDFATGTGSYSVAIGDFNGDGKPDIAVANSISNTVSIFRNTTTSVNAITFAARIDINTEAKPEQVAIRDLDADGKPDLLVVNANDSSVSVFRNTTNTLTGITFAAKIEVIVSTSFPRRIAIDDIDGDKKPDIAFTHDSYIKVRLNTSTAIGSISFAFSYILYADNQAPRALVLGDLDGDNKPEYMVSRTFSGHDIFLASNNSSPGGVSYSVTNILPAGVFPWHLSLGDLDGDSKPDMVAANLGSTSPGSVGNDSNVSVFRNNSSGGTNTASFQSRINYGSGINPSSIEIADIDGDGRSDMIFTNEGSDTVSILKNASNNANLSALSTSIGVLSPNFSESITNYNLYLNTSTTIVTVTPTRADNTASISVNGIPVVSGTQSQNIDLSLTNNSIAITVTAENGYVTTYTINAVFVNPPITNDQITCQGATIADLQPNGVNINWYQTPSGGTPLASTFPLSDNVTYYVRQTINSVESTSTAVLVTVIPLPSTPTITAGGPTTFCNGESVILTSSSGESYLWSNGATTQSIVVTTSGNYSVQVANNGCFGATSNPTVVNVFECPSVAILKLYIEGYFDTATNTMRPVRNNQDGVSTLSQVENIIIELHNATTYETVATTSGILSTDGTLIANFSSLVYGSYYIVVKGNNLVQTWSASPQLFGSTISSYDFTTAAAMAYGDNMTEVEPNIWAFYSGDINQDGNIDNSDYSIWETDANNFAFGVFATDLNGDGNVDNSDYSIWEKNSNSFIFSVHP